MRAMPDTELTPDQQRRIDQLTDARIERAERTNDDGAPLAPIPLEPASMSIRITRCEDCGPNGRGEPNPDFIGDRGIKGCCEGYGLKLEVTPGMELLLLRMAAHAASNWVGRQKRMLSDDWFDDVEFTTLQLLASYPPHREGAVVAATWPDSPEETAELALLEQLPPE